MKTALFILMTFFVLPLMGQDPAVADTTYEQPIIMTDELPFYPGGDVALQKELMSYIIYPRKEKKKKIQGIVYIEFIVEKDGKVSESRVARGVKDGTGLDEAALCAFRKLKYDFTPGRHSGQPKTTRMIVPVKFKL